MIRFLLASCLGAVLAVPATAATLIHSYDFNTGAVTDSVGGLNGTLVGDATVASGVLQLDGAGDFAELSGYAIPTIGNDFSVALRARRTGVTSSIVELISQGYSTGGPAGYGFYIGFFDGAVRLGDRFPANAVNLVFPTDGAWHDYVLTSAAGTGTRFYIDGTLVFSSALTMDVVPDGSFTRFGNQFDGFNEYFKGELDDIKVWSGALSAQEVEDYSNPAVVPLPAGTPLMLTGLAAFAALSWRNRRRAGA
jgi:hypothetical protein